MGSIADRVTLREITAETVRAVIDLAVTEQQNRFVAPNAVSLAQALFAPEAWYRAIYLGDEPVGFVMLSDDSLRDPVPEEPEIGLWRFMVDAKHQHLGVGRAAMQLVIEHVRRKGVFAKMSLSYVPDEGSPERFYRSFGFRPTGEMDDDEVVMELVLSEPATLPIAERRSDLGGVVVPEPTPRFWELFFAVFEPLPRQGPGNRASAARALALCRDLPEAPSVVDLGCGVGGQTLQLAEFLPVASLVAIDRHVPSIERLRSAIAARGLDHRVRAEVGDMARPELPPESFDLVWSEGALYNLGLPAALRVCRDLLRPGGYLAFTEAVWRKADPPPDVRAIFDQDCPDMGWAADVVPLIRDAGLELVGQFTLPDEAWWDDFYTPMEVRIAELRSEHAGDGEALAILAELAKEPETHRRHAAYYGYEFFVARCTPGRIP